jgi:hypothetical protein
VALCVKPHLCFYKLMQAMQMVGMGTADALQEQLGDFRLTVKL